MPDYPLLECGIHGRLPGMIVCTHVLAGAPLVHYLEPDADDLGEALCFDCHQHAPLSAADAQRLRVICLPCFRTVVEARRG